MTKKDSLPRQTILFLLSLAFFTGCQGLKHVPVYAPGSGVYHVVQKGQTLYGIAKGYGVNLEILKRFNGIRDTSVLRAGRKLWIPGARVVRYIHPTGKPKATARKKNRGPPPKIAHKTAASLIWPVKGMVTSRFGNRRGRHHDGIDIGARKGTAIVAAADGKVMFSGWGPTGYGKMIIIKHAGHLTTVYAHNNKNWVKKNMPVKKGQKIGAVGSTGRSTGPHLHFEVRNDTHPRNPLKYLP